MNYDRLKNKTFDIYGSVGKSNHPRFITFTGADDSTDPERLVWLSKKYPIEWGILYSKKRHGTTRYPRLCWIDKLTLNYGHLLNLSAHLCGEYVEDLLDEKEGKLDHTERFDRVQINTTRTDIKFELLELYSRVNDNRYILQCRKDFPNELRCDWLYDVSGGKGITPDSWPIPNENQFVGYAGGINPDNVQNTVSNILADDYWLDMETGVRTDDKFDLEKCAQVCKIIYG